MMDMMAAITEQQRAITDKNGSLMQQQTTMVTWLKTTAEWLEAMIESQDANMASLESAAVSSHHVLPFLWTCARACMTVTCHTPQSQECALRMRVRD